MNNYKAGPKWMIEICELGSVAREEPKILRSETNGDKQKLKAKARKLRKKYDVIGPFRVIRTGGAFRKGPMFSPVPPIERMKEHFAANMALKEAHEAKKEKLDAMQKAGV